MIDQEKTRIMPEDFDSKQAAKAVKAVIKYAAKSKADSLFMDAPTRILMDIRAFKTPFGKDHFYNINLPHTPFPDLENLDALLVVPDVKGRDPDHIVGEVKDALLNSTRADKIRIREIKTFKQFRDDYSTFEAKRELSKCVDVVIAENKIWKMVHPILGREFAKKKKFALAIPGRKFKKSDIGEQIWHALHKTVLNISLKGANSTIVVGHDTLAEDELASNVEKIVSWLNKSFPGGWANIQKLSLHIGQQSMPPLPIYFSSGSKNDVELRPSTKKMKRTAVEDEEISTQLGKRLRVFPNGHIAVVKKEEEEIDELDNILS